MSDTFVLSHYPLSRAYRDKLVEAVGPVGRYVTINDIRHGSMRERLRTLWSINPARMAICFDDPSAIASVAILQLIAATTRARRLEVVDHTLQSRPIGRLAIAVSGLRFLWACLIGLIAVRRADRDLRRLAKLERSPMGDHISDGAVAYLNTNLWFGQKAGGSVGHVSGVANALMDKGFPLEYLSVGGPLNIRADAMHHELVPPKVFGLPYVANTIRFGRMFERQAQRILQGKPIAFFYQRLSIGNFSGVKLSRDHGRPLVVEYNGSEVWVAQKWGNGLAFPAVNLAAEQESLRHAHLVVTISNVLRDELIEHGVEPARIITYPNCIDPTMYDPARFSAKDLATVRRDEGIPEDAVLCTFVGTFGAWHGAEVFAQAIRTLCTDRSAEREAARLHFLFVGDGLRMNDVRRIVADPACAAHVRFTGLVEQTKAPVFLAASDVLVSPHVPNADGTRFFGSPTKLFEYMAMGKAILASDLEQIGEVLRPATDLVDGGVVQPAPQDALALLVPPGDADALASGLLALARDPALRARIGANARKAALDRYTWGAHVDAILQGLKDVASRAQRDRA